MHNITSRRTASKERDRFNANLFDQSLSSHMYNYWVGAQSFFNVSTTTAVSFTDPTNTIAGSIAMGDAARYSVGVHIPKHREWRSGVVTIQPHLQFGATTGNVAIYCGIYPMANGDNLTAWPSAGTALDKVITAPAGANDLYVTPASVYLSDTLWTAQIDDSHVALQIVIGRNGGDTADTMTGNLYLLGAMVKYLEGERYIGEAYDPIRR